MRGCPSCCIPTARPAPDGWTALTGTASATSSAPNPSPSAPPAEEAALISRRRLLQSGLSLADLPGWARAASDSALKTATGPDGEPVAAR
ncbi:hypothetical protein G6F65_023453 [Rhizopus arrhizus]|nr:hypothetical protein G6F65_023453 [Rhizopus arrhizus]